METDSDLTPYELRVKRNIEENQRVLKSLGLLNAFVERKPSIKKTGRRSNVAVKSRNSFKPNNPLLAESSTSSPLPARRTRRSSSILKSQGYDEFDDVPIVADEENTPPHKRKKIVSEPVFGLIEGVSVGDWWSSRIECSAAGVHRPTVAGIHGKLGEGCYSIALSGGYEDDVDYGEYFTYTGSGGRDLKGTKANPKNLRTAPQTKDQVLDGPNAALALNVENHRPVRVIRGYKLPSPYAPEEGYRYDGLYSVERCWTATGLAGFKVFKFALKRLPGQEPPPWIMNGTNVSVQNGDCEQNELAEEVNNTDDFSNTECVTSNATDQPTRSLKLQTTLNSDPNIKKNEEITVIENDSEKTSKTKITSTDLKFDSKNTRQRSKSPTGSQNFTLSEDKFETEDQIVTTEIKNTSENLNIDSKAPLQEPLTDAQNSNGIVSGDKKVYYAQATPKRKRSLSNSKLSSEETKCESKSPADSYITVENALEDGQEIEKQSHMTPKRKRISASPKSDSKASKSKIIANNLNFVSEETPRESPTDSLNYNKTFLDCKKHAQTIPKRERTSNRPKFNPEGCNLEQKTLNDSCSPLQNDSEDIPRIQTTPKMKKTITKSKFDPEVSLNHNDCENAVQNISDEDATDEHSHVKLKRKRTSMSPIPNAEERNNPDKSFSGFSNSIQIILQDQEKLEDNCLNIKKSHENPINADKSITNETVCLSNIQPKLYLSNSKLNNDNDSREVCKVPKSPDHHCQVQMTPLRECKVVLDANCLQMGESTVIISPTSGGKKVRFSPDVVFKDEENQKSFRRISNLNSENRISHELNYSTEISDSAKPIIFYSQENDQNKQHSPFANNSSDSKKQASILKYFGPVKKAEEKQVLSRAILLRSNRRSYGFNNVIPVSESLNLKSAKVHITSRMTQKTHSELLESSEENCKINRSESLETSPSYSIKACSIPLFRVDNVEPISTSKNPLLDIIELEDSFLGWDYENEWIEFLGFDLDGDDKCVLFHGFQEEDSLFNASPIVQKLTSVLLEC